MSTTTDVLSLFKYDPVADADSTFNITQGLNNNWDKIDTALLLAIAAAGAYNPEESYAVGDYCTYKGKLHKCSTAIPTGEPWTEAHWTTTTVAAELAELSSQLSNLKIKTYTSFIQLGLSGEIAPDQLFNALPTGSILITSCGIPNTLSERPTESQYGYIFCYKMSDATASFEWGEPPSGSGGYGNLYRAQYRTLSSPSFTGWRKLATATTPQEFDLPLAEGVSNGGDGHSIYWKDQFNQVHVIVNASVPQISVSNGYTVATLPEGFRPSKMLITDCSCLSDNVREGGLSLNFSTNGTIKYFGSFRSAGDIIWGVITFVAAG